MSQLVLAMFGRMSFMQNFRTYPKGVLLSQAVAWAQALAKLSVVKNGKACGEPGKP